MAGGDPMLVLRRSADVVRSLVGGTHFAMAGLTGDDLPGGPAPGRAGGHALGGRLVTRGTVVLPSLIAAAHDLSRPAPCKIAFGAGPHFCPGAALPGVAGVCAGRILRSLPQGRAGCRLEWQPGTLSVPREIVLALR